MPCCGPHMGSLCISIIILIIVIILIVIVVYSYHSASCSNTIQNQRMHYQINPKIGRFINDKNNFTNDSTIFGQRLGSGTK